MKKEEYQNVRIKHLRTRSKTGEFCQFKMKTKNSIKEFSYSNGKRLKYEDEIKWK